MVFPVREKAGSGGFSATVVNSFLNEHPVVLLGSQSPAAEWSKGDLPASMGCCCV